MEFFISVVIVVALALLVFAAIMSWLRALDEKAPRFYVGAVVTTVIALVGFWFVFLSGSVW